jgi:hypothetical protein
VIDDIVSGTISNLIAGVILAAVLWPPFNRGLRAWLRLALRKGWPMRVVDRFEGWIILKKLDSQLLESFENSKILEMRGRHDEHPGFNQEETVRLMELKLHPRKDED